MADKKIQPGKIFAKNIKSSGESGDLLGGIESFCDEEHPLIIISPTNSDIHFSGHDDVPLKSQSILEDDDPENYLHLFEDSDQRLISIDDCNGDHKSMNYSSSNAESSWPPLKKITQLPQRDDGRWPLERVRNDDMECLNFRDPTAEEEPSPSNEGASGSKPDPHREIPDICWEDYKSFLFRVWEENSLDNSSLDAESSTLPSISSISGDVPYALQLLTKEKEPLNLNLSFTPKPFIYDDILINSEQHKLPSLKEQRNSSNINSQSFSILEKKFQPHPLAKETSTLQGEASRRPSLALRPNVLPPPLKEGRDSPNNNQIIFKTPSNLFSKKSPRIAKNESNNTNTIQNPTNEVVETRIKMPFPSQQHNSSYKNYEAGASFPQVNQPYFNDRGQALYHGNNLCYHRNEIQDIKVELERAQSQIANLSYKMEDQSSHLERLIEERNALQERLNEVIRPPSSIPGMTYPLYSEQGYKSPHLPMYPSGMDSYTCNPHQSIGRRASWQYPCDLPRGRMSGGKGTEELMTHLTRNDPVALANLRARIMALQEQNFELNFFLKKEEQRRKEAEDAVRKEQQYVRKLQESIQDISSSTLVIDPLTYKQVADNYIASQKKPVRRTHTCNPYIGSSDLVCDSNRLQVAQNKTQSTSCPSSPLGSNHDRKASNSNSKLSSTVDNHMPSQYDHQENGTELTPSINWVLDVGGSSPPVSHHQYQDLLSSFDGLQVSSSPS